MSLSTRLRLILVLIDHEPFGFFEDPLVSFARFLCCNRSHRSLYPKHQRGTCPVNRGTSRSSKTNVHVMCPAARQVSGPPHQSSFRQSPSWVIAPYVAATRSPQSRPFVYGVLFLHISLLVFLKVFAYEGVVSSMHRRRYKPRTRQRTSLR